MSIHFDERLQEKVDRFALNLVKEYRRYVAGEGYANEESSKLFGCSVFAHYLAKCNHSQKLMKQRNIPVDPAACNKQRHHFFLCTGSVFCKDAADMLITCVKNSGASNTPEMRKHCPQQYEAFLTCYIDKINKNYPDKKKEVCHSASK